MLTHLYGYISMVVEGKKPSLQSNYSEATETWITGYEINHLHNYPKHLSE